MLPVIGRPIIVHPKECSGNPDRLGRSGTSNRLGTSKIVLVSHLCKNMSQAAFVMQISVSVIKSAMKGNTVSKKAWRVN